MKLFALALLSGLGISVARETPDLADLRTLATAMLKQKDLGGSKAYCEFAITSQINACAGPANLNSRDIVRPDGTVESFEYLSAGESSRPVGQIRGATDKTEWKKILTELSKLKWVEDPDEPGLGGSMPPPPGPSESILIFKLSDGKRTAEYSYGGRLPNSVHTPLHMPSSLARNAADTVWSLTLAPSGLRPGKGNLEFTGRWTNSGKKPVRIVLPDSGHEKGCGRAKLRWYLDTSTYASDWSENADALKSAAPTREWKVASGKSAGMVLHFPFTPPKSKGTKRGKIAGIGVLVYVDGAKDPIPVTVFTDWIDF